MFEYDIFDCQFATVCLPENGTKQWCFDICDNGISVSPNEEGIGTPEFAEAFKQAQHYHRQFFDDTLPDSERSEYAIRWRKNDHPFKFKWLMGMTDKWGDPLDDDWGYNTMILWDCQSIREGRSEAPIVNHFMPVEWRNRELAELKAEHNQALRAKELEVIRRLGAQSPNSILNEVERIIVQKVQSGVSQGIAQAIQEGTATLKEIHSEKQRLEAQLKQLEIAEQKAIAREQEKATRKVNKTTAGYVYILRQVGGEHYKIGRTANPANRLKTFSVKLPFSVKFDVLIETPNMYQLEADLHVRFATKRVDGEWFELSAEDIGYIKEHFVCELGDASQ
jgi:hypothetical protein